MDQRVGHQLTKKRGKCKNVGGQDTRRIAMSRVRDASPVLKLLTESYLVHHIVVPIDIRKEKPYQDVDVLL